MDGKEWLGKVIDGRYVVEAVLGHGGMGLVLKARHKFTGGVVALKMLHGHLRLRGDLADRFLAEARAPATIGHAGIVAVTDAGTTAEGELYLVMELLQGLALRDIAARGRLPLGAVRRIGLDLLAALGAAHAAGFVHRDLKPENLFVTNGGNVKLLDFGIAKVLTEDVAGKGHTAVGSVLGTLWYMAPEQLNDSRSVDLRADLWAVGVIIYELLAGILPYQADTVVRMMAMMMTQDPDPIARHIPDAPPALTAFMARALAREPAWRFQSAAEMAAALAALPVGPEGDVHPALLVNPNATPPPLHGMPTPPPLHGGPTPPPPMHGGPTPPPYANPYAGHTPSPHVNPYGGHTPPPSVYPFPAANPPPYMTGYPNPNFSQIPPLASQPAPVVVPKTVATAGRPARWPYILGALGLSAGIAVGIVALAGGPSPKTEEEPAKRAEPASPPKSDVLAELHQKQDPPPPLPAPPPPEPAPVPPSKSPVTHTTTKKPAPTPPKPTPQPVVTPPPAPPQPQPQPQPQPPPEPTPPPVQPQPAPPQPQPQPGPPPVRPGDYRTDAQACADGCRLLARCGMYADRNCEAGCTSNPVTVACAHRANDCNTAASCVLASVCSGATPRGYATCSATAQCEASCGTNLACGCRCVQNMHLRHAAALVVLNQCAVSCGGNMQCLQQKCASSINRCSRE